MSGASGVKIGNGMTVAQNRRARHDYTIEDTFEAGLMLTGTEVKSLREGQANIQEGHIGPDRGELYLFNAHISEYGPAPKAFQHLPRRPRKLLLHKREMNKLMGMVQREGYTIVPLSLYFTRRGLAKLSIGLAKGKKKHDKRAADREKSWQRDKARIMREKG